MRILLPAALLAVVALSGCASRPPSAGTAPPPASVPVGKSNRFAMTQNGRQMSAEDFDAWMKARGIRIAKGAPAAKRQPKAWSSVQAQAKPPAKAQPKRR